MDVPAGATDIKFEMSGGTGDADIYVKFGSAPTTSDYDCRPYKSGNNETCTGSSTNGTYHVMVRAYSSFSGVSLVGSFNEGGTPGNELENGVAKTGLNDSSGGEQRFTMTVPAGASNINFQMSGGSGDADLYVKFGSEPTTSDYDCRPFRWGNNESCTGSSSGGVYHVMIRGYSSYSGVSLVGSYTGTSQASIMPVMSNGMSAQKVSKGDQGSVNLTWDKGTSSKVDIYRNGRLISTQANNGKWSDNLGKRPSGHFSYRVCDQGSKDCSASITVNF